MISPELDTSRTTPNSHRPGRGLRVGAALAAPALAAIVAVTGCSAEPSGESRPSAPATAQQRDGAVDTAPGTIPPDLKATAEQARRDEAKAYFYSPERKTKLDAAIDATAKRMLPEAERLQVGEFGFSNDKGVVQERSGYEGWGTLHWRHPRPDGSSTRLGITIYQNADGSIARERGVRGVEVGDDTTVARLDHTDSVYTDTGMPIPPSASLWTTPDLASRHVWRSETYDHTAAQLLSLDDQTIATANRLLDEARL